MSVLIKGMEKPKSCESCPFEDFGGCMFRVQKEDCPLVEIPTPHGRLIDADAVLLQYNGSILTAQCDYAEGLRDAAEDVKTAPTIIEAEEGEEE